MDVAPGGKSLRPHLVDRFLHQRVERRRDEEVEVGDLRELPQGFGRTDVRLLDDLEDVVADPVAVFALVDELADHVVQRPLRRDVLLRDLIDPRQPAGNVLFEEDHAPFEFHMQQVRPDDRDDAPLVERVEQAIPDIILPQVVSRFGDDEVGGHGHALSVENRGSRVDSQTSPEPCMMSRVFDFDSTWLKSVVASGKVDPLGETAELDHADHIS